MIRRSRSSTGTPAASIRATCPPCKPVAGAAELAAGRDAVRQVLVADEVLGYIVDIAGATRHSPSLQLGVSPRGATALLATARSWAWLSGRSYVTPDDVKAMARPTLRHRVALRPEAELEGANPDGVLDAAQQRRRPAARGDAPARLAGDAGGRRQPGAGRRRARGRPRRDFRPPSRPRSRPSADRDRPARVAGLPPRRLGQRHRRDRTAHLAGARRCHPRLCGRGRRSPSSTPSRRSCIARASTCRWRGFSRATTRSAPAAPATTTSIVRSTARQYDAFVDALSRRTRPFHEWEATTPYFDGCLPIEVMAERGRETLRHGPMKPVGLTNRTHPTEKAYAVVQLRQDNKLGTLFNMVGFQTKLKHGEQAAHLPHHSRPGARRIRAARRPASQHLPQFPEAARWAVAAARDAAAALRRPDHRLRRLCGIRRHRPAGRPSSPPPSGSADSCAPPPATTAHGALLDHITGGHVERSTQGRDRSSR